MDNLIKFDEFDPQTESGEKRPLQCLRCEQMLADALDGVLSPEGQAWFDRHVTGCTSCNAMFADAMRGAAWLELLKTPRPEPSTDLLHRIFAETCGGAGLETGRVIHTLTMPSSLPSLAPLVPLVAVPMGRQASVLAFPARSLLRKPLLQTLFEPRLMMTAAMAFFSIALTLNLTGVRLDQLHASDLKPNNLKRSYYEANARTVRYYDNLHMVQVLESRVDNLRGSNSLDRLEGNRVHSGGKVQRQPEIKHRGVEDGPVREHKKTEKDHGTSRLELPGVRLDLQLAEEKCRSTRSPLAVFSLSTKDGGLA